MTMRNRILAALAAAAALAASLAAVLAIAERDMALVGPCPVNAPYFPGVPAVWCELRHGHSGDHKNGSTRWRERP